MPPLFLMSPLAAGHPELQLGSPGPVCIQRGPCVAFSGFLEAA